MNAVLDEQGIRLLALHLLVQGHAIPTLRVLHFHPNAPGLWGHCQSIITPVQPVFKGLKRGSIKPPAPAATPSNSKANLWNLWKSQHFVQTYKPRSSFRR